MPPNATLYSETYSGSKEIKEGMQSKRFAGHTGHMYILYIHTASRKLLQLVKPVAKKKEESCQGEYIARASNFNRKDSVYQRAGVAMWRQDFWHRFTTTNEHTEHTILHIVRIGHTRLFYSPQLTTLRNEDRSCAQFDFLLETARLPIRAAFLIAG